MKKGYYISYGSASNFSGVNNKIDNQIQILKKYFLCEKIIVPKEGTNFFKSIIWRLPFGSFGRDYNFALKKIEKADFIYIRFLPVDRRFLNFIKCIHDDHSDAKIIMEIPTFPYGKELLKNITMFPFFFKDIIYRGQLKKYIDCIVTFSNDPSIFGIQAIKTMNGIIVDNQKMVKKECADGIIRLIGVAMFNPGHGYERVIKGLANYYQKGGNRILELHLVGDGTELNYYRKLVRVYRLASRVYFYGRKEGEELEQIYDNMDIGLGCFGDYKTHVYRSSALKVREYLAKGLPVVTGDYEDILECVDTKYIYSFPNDKSIPDMEEIVRYYGRIYQNNKSALQVHKEIKDMAKKTIDMERVMQPVVGYIERNREEIE